MHDLLELLTAAAELAPEPTVADFLPDSVREEIRDAMPDWLRYLLVTGLLAFAGYGFWAALR
jgi:hypothetical protein